MKSSEVSSQDGFVLREQNRLKHLAPSGSSMEFVGNIVKVEGNIVNIGVVILSFASKSDDANSSSYGAGITSIKHCVHPYLWYAGYGIVPSV